MAQANDEALQAALAQFNDGLKTQRAEERAQQAIAKAERGKQQAASELKNVQSKPDATGEEKAEAEAAYRAAMEEFNRLRSGEAAPESPEEPDGESDSATEVDEPKDNETDTGNEPEEAAVPADSEVDA